MALIFRKKQGGIETRLPECVETVDPVEAAASCGFPAKPAVAGPSKERRSATFISVALHLCALSLLMIPSFEARERPFHVVMVDFSLPGDSFRKPSAPEGGAAAIKETQPVPKKKKTPARAAGPKNPAKRKAAAVPAKEEAAFTAGTAVAAPADPPGETDAPSPSEPDGAATAQSGAPEGTADGGRAEGQGTNGPAAGGEDYNFIRNAVMRNIRYPERARRLGMEGKVLLFFVVLENGTTSEIKVIDSSDHRLLDESAIDAVARTRVTRKVPCRVAVCLPILYTLRESGNDRS
jgi:protein TonB